MVLRKNVWHKAQVLKQVQTKHKALWQRVSSGGRPCLPRVLAQLP